MRKTKAKYFQFARKVAIGREGVDGVFVWFRKETTF